MNPKQEDQYLQHLLNQSKQIGAIQNTLETNCKVMTTVQEDLKVNNDKLHEYNDLLSIHIKGVTTNAERLTVEREERKAAHAESIKRIGVLEESPNFWKKARVLVTQSAATITSLGILGGIAFKVAQALEWIPK